MFLFCRRGGNIAKSAQELNLALQEISWVTNVRNIWATILTGADGIASWGLQIVDPWKWRQLLCLKDESAGKSCKFVLSGITDPILYLNLKLGNGQPLWLPLKTISGWSLISGSRSILTALLCCLNPNVNLVILRWSWWIDCSLERFVQTWFLSKVVWFFVMEWATLQLKGT